MHCRFGEKAGLSFQPRHSSAGPVAAFIQPNGVIRGVPVKSAWNVGYVQKFVEEGVQPPQDILLNRLFLHGVNIMLNNILPEGARADMALLGPYRQSLDVDLLH